MGKIIYNYKKVGIYRPFFFKIRKTAIFVTIPAKCDILKIIIPKHS